MLKGQLEELALLDMCRLVRNARETGILSVTAPGRSGLIYFVDGDIRYARSSRVPVGFARDLVVRGALSEDQLKRLIELCARSGEAIEEALVEHGLVSRHAVEKALLREMLAAGLDLLRWREGSFEFERDGEIQSALPARLTVDLFVEKARYIAALERLEDAIPRLARPTLAPGDDDRRIPALKVYEWQLLALIDGRRTVAEIARKLRLSVLTVLEALLYLLREDLVGLQSKVPSEPVIDLRDEVVQEVAAGGHTPRL
jgi:hypothetical protein